MAGYNRVIIVGNLTKDPDYKQLTSGQAICRLSIASNRQYKNKQTGAMVQEVCYVDVDVWGAQAESCRQYLQKGRAILVEGRLKLDTWEDAGQKRSKHSIVADRVVFLSGPSSSDVMTSDMSDVEEKITPKNQMERDLLSQIDDIKSRGEAKVSAAKKATEKKPKSSMGSTGMEGDLFNENEFKDEPPFQDDLPF